MKFRVSLPLCFLFRTFPLLSPLTISSSEDGRPQSGSVVELHEIKPFFSPEQGLKDFFSFFDSFLKPQQVGPMPKNEPRRLYHHSPFSGFFLPVFVAAAREV